MDEASTSALDLARAVAAGEVSPVETIAASLERIERLNPAVNAFAWVRSEQAMEDARRAEKDRRARVFEGVPFTVKDLTAIVDGPSQQGSRAFEGHRAGVDAEVVRRLKAAGAILVGTTAASEFGNRPTTESDLLGITRNPWDATRTSGGSSGGAGVSAAIGSAPLNQGSDGGGSIRIPAACCGVFGIKPSRGRITLGPLMSEEWGGLDVYGPITRTVADAAAFLDVTAGPSTGDPYWAPPPSASFAAALQATHPLRIAVAYERDGEAVDDECKEAVRATAALLEGLGHSIVEAQPDLLPLERPFLIVSTVGIGVLDLSPEQLELIEPRTRLIFDVAREVLAVDHVRALNEMHAASRRVLAFFDDYDVLLTPTLSRAAPRIGEIGGDTERAWEDYRTWLCWTWPWNVTGQPAASVPVGFTRDGLPIGVQVVGGAAAEATILSVSAELERARPWAHQHPPVW